MEKKKHTPGPWMVIHDNTKNFIETEKKIPGKGYYIAFCSGEGAIGVEQAAANANLIAAAPEMLDALYAIQQGLIDGSITFAIKDHLYPANVKLLQAIAKAEGDE